MPVTYDLISSTTLGSNTTTVSFSSIPTTYTDLELIINGIGISGGTDWYIRFNSDSGANYYRQGTAAWKASGGSQFQNGFQTNSATSGQIGFNQVGFGTAYSGSMIMKIGSYLNTTAYKHWITRGDSAFSAVGQETCTIAGAWANTTAISSISLSADNFGGTAAMGAGSVISLYGIKAA